MTVHLSMCRKSWVQSRPHYTKTFKMVPNAYLFKALSMNGLVWILCQRNLVKKEFYLKLALVVIDLISKQTEPYSEIINQLFKSIVFMLAVFTPITLYLHPSVIVVYDSRHLGLLQHYFRHPH